MKRILLCAAAMSLATQAHAGGRLETVDIGAPIGGGQFLAEVIPIFWDQRCANIEYTHANTPANAGTADEISVATLVAEQQVSFDEWNDIETSYIEMNIVNVETDADDGSLIGFDFINELTWNTPAGSGFLASAPSTSLVDETTFVVGDDIDGDGDNDVFDPAVEGRTTCFDADGDGDIEFPAGDYAAGTVLDNDVQYNDVIAGGSIIWNIIPSSTGAGTREVDVQAVAIHEFGHSHSLAHSMINQISDDDGTGTTMFPFIDIDDAASEAGQRTLHTDDIAWSSFSYPEGSANFGIAALQPGDVAFEDRFDVIEGSLMQNGFGVLGGSVQATARNSGEIVGEGYSGFALLISDATGNDLFLVDGAGGEIIDGDFEIPVARGSYDLRIEALDGDPAAAGNISLTAIIGNILGQQNFAEEGRGNGNRESDSENRPGFVVPFSSANPNSVEIITNNDVVLRNAGALTNIGTGAAIGVTDVIYAERFANADVLALLDDRAVLTTGLFRTGVFDASTVGVFKRASIILGSVNPDGTANININDEYDDTTEFVGQDGDLTPFYFQNPNNLSRRLRRALDRNPDMDVFLVLEALDDPVVGDSGLPPLLGLAAEAPSGFSYLSVNGGPFLQRPNNWTVEMRFTP